MANLRATPVGICLATGLTIVACIGQHGEAAHSDHQLSSALRGENPAAILDGGEHDPPGSYRTDSAPQVSGAVASTGDPRAFYGASQDPSTDPWTFVLPPRRKI